MLLKPEDLPLINHMLSQCPELCQDFYSELKLMQHRVGRLCSTVEAMRQPTTPAPPVDLSTILSTKAREVLLHMKHSGYLATHLEIQTGVKFASEAEFQQTMHELVARGCVSTNKNNNEVHYWSVTPPVDRAAPTSTVDLTETDSESTGSAQDLTRSERAQEMLTWARKNYSVGQHIPPGVMRRELGFSKEHFTNSVRELISESTLKSNDEHGLKRRYWLVSR